MGEKIKRGINALYTELLLTMLIISFTSAIISIVRDVPSDVKINETPPITAFMINGTSELILTNSQSSNETALILCLDNDSTASEEIEVPALSTVLLNISCSDFLIVYDDQPVPMVVLSLDEG